MTIPHDIHQIWLGGEMPPFEARAVAGVRTIAERSGWRYKLWGAEELRASYGGEPMGGWIARAFEALPCSTTWALASDYYRLRILADEGGLYLDTDFVAHRGLMPEFPEADVVGMPEFFARTRCCTGLFFSRSAPMRLAADLAAERLLRVVPPDSGDFAARLVDLVRRDVKGGGLAQRGIGPGWLRRVVWPAWRDHGYTLRLIAEPLASHRQWRSEAALVHHGAARWHEARGEALSALWQARAEAAARPTGTLSDDPTSPELPAWLRPQGRSLLPARSQRMPRRSASAIVDSASRGWPQPFALPHGTRRVVVFSNVTTGFDISRLDLREGDLCIHCNHARHAGEAMRIDGTRHALFVRHGHGRDPRGWHWYHDGRYDGYERVLFIADTLHLRPFAWYREWHARSRKSPTTGFIAANMIRELYPDLPLILAGFDPSTSHGTPMWDGHDWDAEAAWYRDRGFCLLRPGFDAPRILLLVTSCLGYTDRAIRSRDAAACRAQRRAFRRWCLRDLVPANITTLIIVGEGDWQQEPGVTQLPIPDDYRHLPAKVVAGMRHALSMGAWDWLLKCDDDTFVHLDRLTRYAATLPPESRDIYGGPIQGRPQQLCGGAGYILHRLTVEAIIADHFVPATGREDVEITRAVQRQGGRVLPCGQMIARSSPHPAAANHLITAHRLTPSQLRSIHTDCYLL